MKYIQKILCSFFIITVIFSVNTFPKSKYKNGNGWGGFKLQSVNGSFFLNGDYRIENSHLLRNYRDEYRTATLSGDLIINTRSELLHPNFLLIDLGGAYSPGARRENYLVAPDRTDTKTTERLNLGLTFFNQRPITVNLFGDYSHNFVNRELTSDIESNQFRYGANLNFSNKFLPVSARYMHNTWKQNELQNLRQFKTVRENVGVDFKKSFSNYDETELKLSYDDYSRKYINDKVIDSYISSYALRNRLFFTSDRHNSLNSYLWYQVQKGNQKLRRIQFSENLNLRPIEVIDLRGRYQYTKNDFFTVESDQHSIFGEVVHHLYRSLDSYFNYEFIDHKQTFFDEKINRLATGVRYNKIIPTGFLNIAYEYNWRSEDKSSDVSRQFVVDEQKSLLDGDLILLNNPNVSISSILVTDETSTIIYQEVLDYLLIPRGEFIEIIRVPGGQISNGQTVQIDYEFVFRADYKFTASGNRISTSVNFLNNLFDVYFRYNDLGFDTVDGVGFNILKYFTQKIYGIRLQYSIFTAGFEYDDYSSNITPYKSERYHIDANSSFFQRLLVYLSAGYRKFKLLDENEIQNYKDASARITYLFNPLSRLTVVANGRMQEGRGLDLDWSSLRTEYSTQFRKIMLVLGYENVYRNFAGDRISYNNFYIRIGRNF